eukprot:7723822-Pyramimonas_sp.AAC.3
MRGRGAVAELLTAPMWTRTSRYDQSMLGRSYASGGDLTDATSRFTRAHFTIQFSPPSEQKAADMLAKRKAELGIADTSELEEGGDEGGVTKDEKDESNEKDNDSDSDSDSQDKKEEERKDLEDEGDELMRPTTCSPLTEAGLRIDPKTSLLTSTGHKMNVLPSSVSVVVQHPHAQDGDENGDEDGGDEDGGYEDGGDEDGGTKGEEEEEEEPEVDE